MKYAKASHSPLAVASHFAVCPPPLLPHFTLEPGVLAPLKPDDMSVTL